MTRVTPAAAAFTSPIPNPTTAPATLEFPPLEDGGAPVAGPVWMADPPPAPAPSTAPGLPPLRTTDDRITDPFALEGLGSALPPLPGPLPLPLPLPGFAVKEIRVLAGCRVDKTETKGGRGLSATVVVVDTVDDGAATATAASEFGPDP